MKNKKIYDILIKFIDVYNHKFDKSWQTVNILFKDFFKENGVVFPRCNDMKPEFWISRGWDNPSEKIAEIVKPFPTTKEYWIQKGFSEIEAKEKATLYYNEKLKGKRMLPTQLEYYIQKKGMSEEDAKQALSTEQTRRYKFLKETESKNPEIRKRRLWTHIEYWTSRGYSKEDGYRLMSEKENSKQYQTMEKLIKKIQKQGYSYDESVEKANLSYKERASKTMQTRIKNNSFGFQKASQLSLKFFKPLMDKLDRQGIEYYVGAEGNTEFFLASGTEYFYSYDFYIPSKKLIIEFHGEHVHPNPKMTKEEWHNWKHCWTKKSADECRAEDLKKINLATSKGFQVIEVFESDDIDLTKLI